MEITGYSGNLNNFAVV
ncbi:hypothetical protein [Anabaena catenula]